MLTAVAVLVPAAVAAAPRAAPLPPDALRGNEHRLRQYPVVALASARERAAATDLLARIHAAVRVWSTPAEAERAGFDTGQARHRPRRIVVAYLHAEHRVSSGDRRYLDPARPEALIYANIRGRPLSLVGAMFSMPRGKPGPTPGGPITRWHTHTVCARGARRGVAVRGNGSCPPGLRKREGSEMLHVWFTGGLRSSFAIHGPEPELCRARLLSASVCARRGHAHPAGPSRPPVPHPPPPRPPPPGG